MSDAPSIVICVNRRFSGDKPSCAERGAEQIVDELELALARAGLDVELSRVYCLGNCSNGPNLRIAPGGRMYSGFTVDDIPQLLDEMEQAF